jgi:mRNA interferase RelE/StbE
MTQSSYELQYFKSAALDYQHLDGSQKIFVDKGLTRIKKLGMLCGEPFSGPLAGYHKLKNRKMGLRIVFGAAENKIQIINIVALGKREDKKVYHQAAERLKHSETELK